MDETVDQTFDNDVQIDSSSPAKPVNPDSKWQQPFKWGENEMVFDYLNPKDLQKKEFNDRVEKMSAG